MERCRCANRRTTGKQILPSYRWCYHHRRATPESLDPPQHKHRKTRPSAGGLDTGKSEGDGSSRGRGRGEGIIVEPLTNIPGPVAHERTPHGRALVIEILISGGLSSEQCHSWRSGRGWKEKGSGASRRGRGWRRGRGGTPVAFICDTLFKQQIPRGVDLGRISNRKK